MRSSNVPVSSERTQSRVVGVWLDSETCRHAQTTAPHEAISTITVRTLVWNFSYLMTERVSATKRFSTQTKSEHPDARGWCLTIDARARIRQAFSRKCVFCGNAGATPRVSVTSPMRTHSIARIGTRLGQVRCWPRGALSLVLRQARRTSIETSLQRCL